MGDDNKPGSGDNNQDQLLQDASTLLLFANTAAKQQETKKSPSPPAQVQGSNQSITPSHRHSLSHSYTKSVQQLPVIGVARDPSPSTAPGAAPGVAPAHHGTVFDPVRQTYTQPSSGTPSHNSSPGPGIQNIPPQANQPPGGQTGIPQGVHHGVPPPIPPIPSHHPFGQNHSQIAPSHPHNFDKSQTNSPPVPSIKPTLQVHYQDPLPHKQPSVNPLPTDPSITVPKHQEPLSPKFPPPFNSAPVSHNTSTRSSISEQSSNQQRKLQPPQPQDSGLSHRRTNSSPENEITSSQLKNSLSPGPASVVLARGVDNESGKRINNNAMIAAAALAQAADNPLPLLKREEAKRVALESGAGDTTTIKQEPEQQPETTAGTNTTTASKDLQPTNPLSVRRSVVDTTYIAPPLQEYQVDPDSGIIGCICNIDDDDGFTIQCDICFRWQHCLCMDYSTNDEIPEDEYKCYYCDKEKWGKFDPEACRINTLARLEADKSDNNNTNPTNDYDDKNTNNDNSNINDNDNAKTTDTRPINKRKVLNHRKVDDKKRRKVEQTNDSNVSKGDVNNTTTNNNKVSKDRKKQLRDDFNNVPAAKVDETPSFIPNKDNELLEDGFTAENYQSTYYKLRTNDYRNHDLQAYFQRLGSQFYERYNKLTPEHQQSLDIQILTLKEFKAIPKIYTVLPNHERHLREENVSMAHKIPKISVQVKAYSDSQKQKFNGISKLGLFIQHSSKVEKLDKNDGNEKSESDKSNDSIEDFEETIAKGTPLLEYFGVLDLFTEYRDNKTNQYHIWGTTKPKVLKSELPLLDANSQTKSLEVVLDSRFVGNESRFIRKACPGATNCEIKKFYIPDTNSFKFLVVTSKDITLTKQSGDEELRLPWEWDQAQPIRKMYGDVTNEIEGLKFDQLSDKEKSLLVGTIDNILYFTECGCSTTSNTPLYLPNCAVFRVRKAITYLLRSTRKMSGITNVNLYKPREELILPKGPKKYVSWEERLYDRDKFIQTKLFLPAHDDDEKLDLNGDNNDPEEPDINLTLPLRQRLLKTHISKSSSPVKHEDSIPSNEDITTIDGIEASEFIPITTELKDKIKSSVEEEVKIKPEIEKSLSKVGVNIGTDDKPNLEELKKALSLDSEPHTNERNPNESNDNENSVIDPNANKSPEMDSNNADTVTKAMPNPVVPENTESKEEARDSVATEPIPQPKPTVKKKLSFADYKKKMK